MIIREDGYIYLKTTKSGKEKWLHPDSYKREKVNQVLNNIRCRCKKDSIPFDVDIDYLMSIFPTSMKCPVLNINLEWGEDGGRDNSPSIDRIKPELGYIRGNLLFVSLRANRIKGNAHWMEVKAVADFYSMI